MSLQMNDPLARFRALATGAELGEFARVEDDLERILAERSLYGFIKQGWKYLDPAPFVDGWHTQAVCEHLEALCRGDLRHLLINQPPRTMKSITVSVALTPWCWAQKIMVNAQRDGVKVNEGPLTINHTDPPTPPFLGSHAQMEPTPPLTAHGSHIRKTGAHLGPKTSFLYASYGQHLSLRDSVKSRRLMASPWYQKNWKHFELLGDSNTKTRFDNSEGGYRIATSVAGALTGEGADIIICLPYEQKVETEIGSIEIGKIVEKKMDVKILGWDGKKTTWQKIIRHEKNPGKKILKITYNGGMIECTKDHPVFIKGKGYVRAKDIKINDIAMCLLPNAGKKMEPGYSEAQDWTFLQFIMPWQDAREIYPREVEITSIEDNGREEKFVYNIETGPDHNYFASGILVHNCDDPHNTVEIESETVRNGVLQWFDESLSTRHNDPKTGSFIVVMQRLHERDLAGHIMEKAEVNGDWTLLRLPMEYEPTYHCVTKLGWQDPRGIDDDGDRLEGLQEGSNGQLMVVPGTPMDAAQGELLWPERFGAPEVEALKKALGPFACTPGESPVLMSDLSMKPIGEVKIGDEVVGFEIDTAGGTKRKSLRKAKVTNKFEYMADIVRVTLESGRVIRCTPDHKWYMGKQGGHRGWHKDGSEDLRPVYRPAIIGRKLMRVCDPELLKLTPEQERIAGWLGGFFDGEGSASECAKKGQKRKNGAEYKSSVQISFHQTAEKNLPICEELEKCLDEFGFDYNIYEKDISHKPHWQKRRHYHLTNGGRNSLQLIQKFIHIVKPVKWRQRIIDGVYTANFISRQETVISIEPDGHEKVYAIETETGNYVVWGLASSNSSGQLQQNPVPKGGGIIKETWWQLFPPKGEERVWTVTQRKWDEQEQDYVERDVLNYPQMEYVIVYADTAYTEEEENDYSAAAMLGVWRDKQGNAKLMLMRAWQERLELHKLVQKLATTCRLNKKVFVDALVIENKASGKSAAQEIKRLFGNEDWSTILADPAHGDKVARAYSIQYLFADKMVFAPARDWTDLAIKECTIFPRGQHDDLPDAIFGGIAWLRKNGYIEMRRERTISQTEAAMLKKQNEPLYDC